MPRVLSATMFFPRGGSSHVARALARGLPEHGWEASVVSGSRSDVGEHADAAHFYAGLDVHAVDLTAAAQAADPTDPPRGAPMHPSYEDRPGAPDRVFAALDDAAYERQVAAWARALAEAGAAAFDVLHLHHLTPVHEAARQVAADVPVVGHLHGTELLMLEAIAAGPPPGWSHAHAWAERMRAWAHRCARLVVLSPSQIPRAEAALGIDPERCVVLPNGFDPREFRPREIDRAAHWSEHLVERPRGWRPPGGPGSVAYRPEEVAHLAEATILLSVGRFTAVKRTGLLIAAFDRARRRVEQPVALVLVGGHAGEWEGEHPAETIERLAARHCFLAGWHDHAALPSFLAASDVLALASVREQFGQVIVEAMACRRPVIAVDRFGPAEIVSDGETGWLVEPDDVEQLAGAIAAALGDPAERERRGRAARRDAVRRYSWPALAGRLAATLDGVLAERPTN